MGAPLHTLTLLHHAEHLARLPDKRLRRTEVPFSTAEGVRWRGVEEFDTSEPIGAGPADDYFADVVRAFLASGQGAQGLAGEAPSVLVEAAPICRFGVRWLERNLGFGQVR